MYTWENCVKDGIATLACVEVIIKNFLNLAVRLAGIAVFIMLIVGGFQYLTAGGDPKKTQTASNTLTYAIFGLVVVIAAWFIMRFIENFTGVKVTEFNIPFAK